MNIFCWRRTLGDFALSSLLGVSSGLVPQFGFRPKIPLRSGKTDRTEIDLKLGHLMVEAKLTETDFQTTSARMIERYRDLGEVFDPGELMLSGDVVPGYQFVSTRRVPLRYENFAAQRTSWVSAWRILWPWNCHGFSISVCII
jgi:hypothetical protein